jgi:hypothetical protein
MKKKTIKKMLKEREYLLQLLWATNTEEATKHLNIIRANVRYFYDRYEND